jgi:hypothetical protein
MCIEILSLRVSKGSVPRRAEDDELTGGIECGGVGRG